MGRALMVGRGATGARLPLVLPILVVLAARSCRAQKGWWQMAEITEQNRTERSAATRRPTRPTQRQASAAFLRVSVHKYGAVLLPSRHKTRGSGGGGGGEEATLHGCVGEDGSHRCRRPVMRACLAQRNRPNRL